MARTGVTVPPRHVALVGFMGAGKTTLAGSSRAADRLAVLRHRQVDRAVARRDDPRASSREGEAVFRDARGARDRRTLLSRRPPCSTLGGGAVTLTARLRALREQASTVWLDVDVDTCWERVRGSDRPLAQDETAFRRLYDQRQPLYRRPRPTCGRATLHDVVLAAAGVRVERGALQRLGALVPGDGPVALVSDPHVAGIHGMDAQLALGTRLAETHELPPGEEAKTPAGARPALAGAAPRPARHDRRARRRLHHRRRRLSPPPRTCVASPGSPSRRASSPRSTRRSAARRRSTCPQGKNLVGAFHWPVQTVIDPALLCDAAGDAAARRDGRGREDRPARGRAALGAARRRARPPLRRVQGRGLPARPARPRRAEHPQPRPHVRARARDRRAATTRSRTARRSRSGCWPRCGSPAATRRRSRRSSARSRCAPTASSPGRRCTATRRRSAASSGSCCSATTGRAGTSRSRPGTHAASSTR